MLFQSWEFLLFFIPFAVIYAALRRTKLKLPLLIVGSYGFYACWDWRSVFFLAFITVSDYLFGRGIAAASERGKKWFLAGSLLVNLGVLCSFKYLNFITENLLWVLEKCGVTPDVPEFDWLLPVGLSFFTFKSMTYTCDLCAGKIRVERNLLRYAAYVAFFPQLVAGPIDRARNLLPQLKHDLPFGSDDFAAGSSVFVTGLFKKLVMADLLAAYVNPVYDSPAEYGGAALLYASYAFAWQIYFDFSGLSDMARGAARMLGFRTMLNFDNPYVSVDVRDFWRRWHISLSTWFRDYVYIPLGGNRVSRCRNYLNLMATFTLSGLWHGANWTFLLWGMFHGGLLCIEKRLGIGGHDYRGMSRLLHCLLTFVLVSLGWVLFRAGSVGEACTVLSGIVIRFGMPELSFAMFTEVTTALAAIAVLVSSEYAAEHGWALRLTGVGQQVAAHAVLLLLAVAILLFGVLDGGQFIYFQF